ncbi:MAG TPA: TauD/TfdA family dioxygenase [Caulobacteraceae bacterium]|nr:TauD/TfdA family dioxygenase [Caulobacteraceae bacterium]
MPARTPPKILDDGDALEVELAGERRRFHAVWLRDNAQDSATRSPVNGQKLITLSDLPADIRIVDAQWMDQALHLSFAPEGKTIAFDADWLLAHAYDRPPPLAPGWTGAAITRWDAALGDIAPPQAYGAVRDDLNARRLWLSGLSRHGFARLTGAPATEGVACEAAGLFGYVRETNYGRAFDVRAQTNASNLAYTNLGLQAHTDNPYRDPAPGLQILACLQNTVEGGESVVVDGFKIVERLQSQSPAGFALLTRYCARFDYAGSQGVRLRSKRPLIELGPDGELLSVRFNNRSAAPLVDIPYDDMAAYYAAYRAMAALVDDPALHIRFQLMPGDLFVVDNLRVLHARTAFSSAGQRWLQGCYADKDGLNSTLAALEGST